MNYLLHMSRWEKKCLKFKYSILTRGAFDRNFMWAFGHLHKKEQWYWECVF